MSHFKPSAFLRILSMSALLVFPSQFITAFTTWGASTSFAGRVISHSNQCTALKSEKEDGPAWHASRRDMFASAGLLAAALCHPNNAFGSTPAMTFNEFDRVLPFSSHRQYDTVTLPNGLRVLLVSDRRAIRASAALNVAGVGQFSDPPDIPGMAHLMEHMILSSYAKTSFRQPNDFEEWLSEREGASNAFTGFDQTCFHFMSQPSFFQEALERFAALFYDKEVSKVCRNQKILKREIRRVDSELDCTDEGLQAYYLVKDMMNPEHPYSRFNRGNIGTLETTPKALGINLGARLVDFFHENYHPANSVLVVVAPTDLSSLQAWVSPFASILSGRKRFDLPQLRKNYPRALKSDGKVKQVVLLRQTGSVTPQSENIQSLSLEWPLDFDYTDSIRSGKPGVTATQIGFIVAQLVGRRGPGSLYEFLLQQDWIPEGNQGVPRIFLPVDVSGFQLMKLEIKLTNTGFAFRSAVVTKVFEVINASCGGKECRTFLSKQMMREYSVLAQLHGYVLTPRPPDAIELSLEGSMYGVDLKTAVGSGKWLRFPLESDRVGLAMLQKAVSNTLLLMRDPNNAFILTTATQKALSMSRERRFETGVPRGSSPRWQTSTLTGANYFVDDLFNFMGMKGKVQEWIVAKASSEDFLPPVTNPFVPSTLDLSQSAKFMTMTGDQTNLRLSKGMSSANWMIISPSALSPRLPLPRIPSESNFQSCFVLQLLSSRPARANVRKAAYSELWRISFESTITDLAELGAPAGLAYEISFNKYGMRICFLGLKQNIQSYSRRFCRRLVAHHRNLLEGPELFPKSTTEIALNGVDRARGMSSFRKRQIAAIVRYTSAYDAAVEGIAFLKSCKGAVCFSQGALSADATFSLLQELEEIFSKTISKDSTLPFVPEIDDLAYKPNWKPRNASPCYIPGVPLISDACGRVPR